MPIVFRPRSLTIFSNRLIQERKRKMNYPFLAVKHIRSQPNPHLPQLQLPNHVHQVILHNRCRVILRLRVFILAWRQNLMCLMGLLRVSLKMPTKRVGRCLVVNQWSWMGGRDRKWKGKSSLDNNNYTNSTKCNDNRRMKKSRDNSNTNFYDNSNRLNKR